MSIDIGEVHKNSKLLIDKIPYNVDAYEFMKPGKGRAIYRVKLRNLLDGTTVDHTYHSGEKVDEISIATAEAQFVYKESDHYVFMNTQTFEQYFLSEDLIGEKKNFLKEGILVTIAFMGERPIDVTLPIFVELKVVKTETSTKSATITPQMKAAVLETGATVGIPPFIKEGDVIKVDTRTGNYAERA